MMNYFKKFLLSGFIGLLAVVMLLTVTTRTTFAASAAETETGMHVLVQFELDTPVETRDALIAQMGGELVTWMQQIHVAEITMPVQAGTAASMAPLAASNAVVFAEENMTVSATYEPNDAGFSNGLMRYALEAVEAPKAWDIITGSQEIIIAVIDTGIKLDHPEFAGRLVPGYDFVNKDDQADDDAGHGTHVAGVIAAALDNGQGVAGVCPNCRLMPVKSLNANKLGSWSQISQGILFAVDNGARVINLSLGAKTFSATLVEAIQYAVDHDVIVVAAAGNGGTDAPFYPAALEGVIAVAATTNEGTRWSKSNFGSYIDIAAPGTQVYSTYNDLGDAYKGYHYMSGTSMAAPFVSGVAGLLLSAESTLSAEQVTNAMILSAEDLGAEGWDVEYGYGKVSAFNALRSSAPDLVENSVNSPAPPTTTTTQATSLYLPALNNH